MEVPYFSQGQTITTLSPYLAIHFRLRIQKWKDKSFRDPWESLFEWKKINQAENKPDLDDSANKSPKVGYVVDIFHKIELNLQLQGFDEIYLKHVIR